MLVAAAFDAGAGRLTLTFDRAVDAAGLAGGAVVVFDGPGGTDYVATSVASQPTPATVVLAVEEDGEFTGAGVTMDATPPTGIVAVAGGLPWAGGSGVGLPFP